MIIRIKGLTHKFKNRIREHGELWRVIGTTHDNRLAISPRFPKDAEFPYQAWVEVGKEIEIIEVVEGTL